MDGMGYIFLRRGHAADSREIHMNYREQFDRNEFDRFTTFFYRNGGQVDSTVARLSYTAPGPAGWNARPRTTPSSSTVKTREPPSAN